MGREEGVDTTLDGGGRRGGVEVLDRDDDGILTRGMRGGGFGSGGVPVWNTSHGSLSTVTLVGAVTTDDGWAGRLPETFFGGGAKGGGSFAGGRGGLAANISSKPFIVSSPSSSPIVGTSSKKDRSESLRETVCAPPALAAFALENLPRNRDTADGAGTMGEGP